MSQHRHMVTWRTLTKQNLTKNQQNSCTNDEVMRRQASSAGTSGQQRKQRQTTCSRWRWQRRRRRG